MKVFVFGLLLLVTAVNAAEKPTLTIQLINGKKYAAIKILNCAGKYFRIEESTDLVNWNIRWHGYGENQVFVNVLPGKMFFRLVME